MKKLPAAKRLIGLTGTIASGKSTALACFEQLGACVISADKLVHELYHVPQVRAQLEQWFGSAERAQVAKAVFSSAQDRKKVEEFLHPLVWQRALEQAAKAPQQWVVFEAPLLLEVGWEARTDLTLLVVANPKTLDARLKARGLSRAAYERRRKWQLPEEEKIRRADIVIFNRGSKQELCAKIKRLYEALNVFYA